jgi:hypothetical protein
VVEVEVGNFRLLRIFSDFSLFLSASLGHMSEKKAKKEQNKWKIGKFGLKKVTIRGQNTEKYFFSSG